MYSERMIIEKWVNDLAVRIQSVKFIFSMYFLILWFFTQLYFDTFHNTLLYRKPSPQSWFYYFFMSSSAQSRAFSHSLKPKRLLSPRFHSISGVSDVHVPPPSSDHPPSYDLHVSIEMASLHQDAVVTACSFSFSMALATICSILPKRVDCKGFIKSGFRPRLYRST